MAGRKRSFSSKADQLALHKECDEAVCSICMDHPHNAVLLLCSSHKKGCRSYMCDTSYRHSNCLDRFKSTSRNLVSRTTSNLVEDHRNNIPIRHSRTTSNLVEDHRNNIPIRHSEAQGESALEARVVETLAAAANSTQETSGQSSLKCPLCRGNVHGWKVVEEARSYLNLKARSCSDESCSFRGNYRELREHARRIHPATRPTEVDPSRQRAWRRSERRWEYADILSTIRAAMPGSTVFGDYVIENEEDRAPAQREGEGEGEGERGLREDVPGPWWATFFLFQMIDSLEPGTEARGRGRGGSRSRGWSRLERPAAPSSRRRRYMWGENLLGLQDENDDDDDDDGASSVNMESDEGEDGSPVPRRRRRLIQSRSDEDQS